MGGWLKAFPVYVAQLVSADICAQPIISLQCRETASSADGTFYGGIFFRTTFTIETPVAVVSDTIYIHTETIIKTHNTNLL